MVLNCMCSVINIRKNRERELVIYIRYKKIIIFIFFMYFLELFVFLSLYSEEGNFYGVRIIVIVF